MYSPDKIKGIAKPIEYNVNNIIPLVIVVSKDAKANIEPKIGPIHGDQPKPNPTPTKNDIYGFVI